MTKISEYDLLGLIITVLVLIRLLYNFYQDKYRRKS